MTMAFLSFFLSMLVLKDSTFFGAFMVLNDAVSFMFFIFPLILLVCMLSSFSRSSFLMGSFSSQVFCVILLFLFLSFSSVSSFNFLVSLEVCVSFMILFIFWFSKDQDKISSALFMFLLNMIPSILFMYFCFFNPCHSFWEESNLMFSSSTIFLCFFLGLLLSKLPMFLIHFWLTKAHVSASAPGSMILASLLLKIGSIGIYKYQSLFLFSSITVMNYFFSLSNIGALIIVSIMIRFVDLKHMVACSSIVHMVPIFPILMLGDYVGVWSSFFMMVGHGVVSYFIFFLVGVFYEGSSNKSSYFMKSLESLSSMSSMIVILFFLFNLGFPPLMTFLSEIFFCSCMESFSLNILCIFLFNLMLSGLVFFFVSSKFVFGSKNLTILECWSVNLTLLSFFYLSFFIVCPLFFF